MIRSEAGRGGHPDTANTRVPCSDDRALTAAYCRTCDRNSMRSAHPDKRLRSAAYARDTKHIPMCLLRSRMTAPPMLLLSWLFYINKHSQNVADKKPVIRLLSDSSVLAAFSFMKELIWAAVTFCSGVNTAGSE